ncbi:MAG: hypothetical protein ACREAD_00725 [Nitrosopumilaceae archaeon]
MALIGKIIFIISLGLLIIGLQHGFATSSLAISTNKQTYEYGDLLSITFRISELTGQPIIIHIIDSSGKTSAPINIPINKLNYTIIAPFPFYKTNYAPGKYSIDAEYSGIKTNVSFNLIDSDKIAIPTEYKTLVKTWLQGNATDNDYAGLIRELIHADIIKVTNYHDHTTNQIHIPNWFKNNSKWWSNDLISDNDFGLAIQYLIKAKIMIV